jgi:hypothetical protein
VYAVYILAAILLSVAPMHASTVFASLPAVASGQRTVCAKNFAERQATREHRGPASLPVRNHASQQNMDQAALAVWFCSVPSVILGVHLLAHAPNAP